MPWQLLNILTNAMDIMVCPHVLDLNIYVHFPTSSRKNSMCILFKKKKKNTSYQKEKNFQNVLSGKLGINILKHIYKLI